MNTQANDSNIARILAIGLQPREVEFAKKFAQQTGAKINGVNSEMDLMEQVRTGKYRMVIVGQVNDTIDPAYLVWLLKGLIPCSNLVLIFNSLSSEDAKKLHEHRIQNIFIRPGDPKDLIELFETALTAKEEKPGTGFMQTLMHWVPFLNHTKAA